MLSVPPSMQRAASRSATCSSPRTRAHHVDRELVVAGGHRRVRREHASAPDRLDVGLVELERLASVELPLEKTERQQRRVAFVQVVDLGLTVQRAEQRGAAHPEHDLLAAGDSGCRRRTGNR